MTQNKWPLAIGLLALAWGIASAPAIANDAAWQEIDTPEPPSFEWRRVIPVVISRQSQLSWGIDPATIAIGADGVVRYVIAARSESGVMNAMYEGIHCGQAQYRRYAFFSPERGWIKVSDSQWTQMNAASASRHPNILAKEGLCDSIAPTPTVDQAIRRLRFGP